MSTFNDIDIECEKCGHEFRGTVWVAVHAGVDPELKELLLGGELNLVSCPECGFVTFQDHFLIYQEPAAELIAYVYPEKQRREEAQLHPLMLAGYREAQKGLTAKQRLLYDPVLFFGLEQLIEMLQAEYALAEQSQIAQVICKENHLNMILLKPSQARKLKMMRVLPRTGKHPHFTREDVLGGIDELLNINPALDLYVKLRKTIKDNPHWKL
jgi:hypothetical protein